MKKFLFTLATLLMAGSMFADNYFYAVDFEVPQELLQNENARQRRMTVNVYAHFDNLVSAWQTKVTLPEKCKISNCDVLEGMTIQGLDAEGNPKAFPVALSNNLTAGTFIGASTEAGYYYPEGQGPDTDDPTPIGANKWVPGDYLMFSIRIEFDQDFAGGQLSFSTSCSCGEDPRLNDGTYTAPANQDYVNAPDDKICDITVEQPQQQPAPAATISNEGNVVTAAVPDETAGTHNVELYIVTTNDEGEEVLTKVDNPYTVEQTFNEQKITFKAKTIANEGESGDTWSEPKEITIRAKEDSQCPQPEFAYYESVNEVWARVMYYGEAPYTEHVELYIVTTNDEGGEVLTPVDNPYKGLPTENNTYEDIVVKFKAIVKADGVNYNVDNYDYYTVTIPGKEDKQAPAPTFRVEGDKLYAEQGGLTVELYKKNDDGTWTKVDNPYEGLPTENTSYTEPIKIDFKAITLADGVTYNVNSDEATYTYTIDPLNKKTAEKPTIAGANLTDATYDIVITPDPNTDGTLEYTATPMGAVVRAGATTIRYERKDTEYTVHVEASTTAGETYLASEVAKADIVIPAKPAPEVIELPDPTISETHDAANQTTIITITVPENTPEGTVLNYTLTDEDGNVIPASDYTVTATDGKIVITIPNGAETAFVTVTATTTMPNAPEGVVVENGEATKTVEVPQYQQTAAPTIDVSFAGEEGHYYANVTFKNDKADPNAVIEYSLNNGETWNTYTGAPVVITEDGPHTVLARATATGKATSEVADRTFELNQTATSVNELVNGKTVAGVRYFNMAGQEMQEANGITIVVTTYTDGTTSAVKVIK